MKILIVDNHDSFTFNLVHYLEQFTDEPISVVRNTELDLTILNSYDKVVLSPGPGLPNETKNLIKAIHFCLPNIPILGVCLGHQALYEAFGGGLKNLGKVIHGESSEIRFSAENSSFFSGIKNPMLVGHYHSWCVDGESLPEELEVLARDKHNNIMAFRHVRFPIHAVQFHPESILTPDGLKLIQNWVKM